MGTYKKLGELPWHNAVGFFGWGRSLKIQIKKKRGVSHCGLAIYIKKYLLTKEELWKLKYFTLYKYNLQKNPLNETKILQDIITLQLISSQNIIFHIKSSYKNNFIITYGPKSFRLLYSILNQNTISLPWLANKKGVVGPPKSRNGNLKT